MDNIIKVVKKQRQEENTVVKKSIYKWIEQNLPKDEYVLYKNWGGGFNKAGRPDIEIAYKGKITYWELKDEKGRVSTLQIATIEAYAKAGIVVHVVDSLEQFLKIWKEEY